MDPNHADLSANLPKTRGYQQEMLQESLRRNIVIALDTGSGKTHIAVLRLKHEAERQTKKISWFLAPTVGLCEQQKDVITNALPVPVGLVSGALNPDQWKDKALWTMVLSTNRIIVSTPQVLLDALRHGYVNLAADLGLMVFDEAHHAADKHPYNMILREFYDKCPDRVLESDNWDTPMKPFILGLTASPIFGGDISRSFSVLEQNMDCIICGPRHTRQELAEYVHRPEFKHVLYADVPFDYISRSRNVSALYKVVSSLEIEEDPFVLSLRKKFNSLEISSPDYHRVDQRLSRVLDKRDSYTHKGLRDFLHAAEDICTDIGVWAADWYVSRVLEHALKGDDPFKGIFAEWQNAEKTYLLSILSEVDAKPVTYDDKAILSGISPKTKALISCLLTEKAIWDANNEIYSGIVFVERRDSVLALEKVLEHHPNTKDCFIPGCLLGSSSNFKRRSFLDITNGLLQSSQSETLRDFRVGEKNVLVSTAVAEEGIDIQACGNVIRWSLPKNMVSWAQSRGRARKQRSSFIVMLCDGHILQNDKTIQNWESLEKDMIKMYTKEREEALIRAQIDEEDEAASTESSLWFRVESTGAVLTLNSAVSHLAHFCSVLPVPSHVNYGPIYDIDPPDYPLGYHSAPLGSLPLPMGPYGATVTLPRLVPPDLRVFRTERIYRTKESARRHVAFKAYVALYKAGLLNENLLPLTSVVEPDLEDEVKALFKDVEKHRGVAKVSLQFNPWEAQISAYEPGTWWQSNLLIEGLPTMTFLSRSPLSEAAVTLYDSRGKREVTIVPRGSIHLSEEKRVLAASYSRFIFSIMHGHKMDIASFEFSYLLLPQEKSSTSITLSHQILHAPEQTIYEPPILAHRFIDTLQFLQEYNSAKEVYLLKDSTRRLFGSYFEFLRLRTTPLSEDEKEIIFSIPSYAHRDDKTIQYPLLLARPLPKRSNFLVPYDNSDEKDEITKEIMLLPQYTSIAVAAPEEVKLSMLFPSIIRALSLNYITDSLRSNLFSKSSLACLSINKIKPAIVAPAASEAYNYQRLETLGDTILKFIVCLQLIAEYPLWHEGYLTRRKDHTVNNAVLAKGAMAKDLYKWIIRDRFVPRRWRPHYIQQALDVAKADDGSDDDDENDDRKSGPTLSIKVLADVVEALIGISYLEGGLDYSIECARIFKVNVPWKSVEARISEVIDRTEIISNVPYQLQRVEKMLGYSFNKKAFLVEALMHASYHSDISTISYERMEFLGDSVLDMIIVEMLYGAPGKNYPPGQIHIRKSALTNKHFLGFICLGFSTEVVSKMPEADEKRTISIKENKQRLYLWQCLLHSSSRILDDLRNTFDRYEKYKEEIETGLLSGALFPWAALTRLQAPKFFGDMIESIIAAVYLDSSGDVTVVKKLLERLGILPIVKRVIDDDVDVRHPVSRVSNWVAKYDKTVEYEFTFIDGNIKCVLLVDEEEIVSSVEKYKGKASQESARFQAAELAIAILSSQIEES